jgi:serine/threonine protein phosphatase PrpC
MRLDIAQVQGAGRRRYQQDVFALSDTSPEAIEAHGFDLVLADGMGGALDGALIAQETVDFLSKHLETSRGRVDTSEGFAEREKSFEQLLEAIREANTRIYARYHEAGGTTLIVARVCEAALWFASVGDSTIYLQRSTRLFELNRRHTFLLDLYERALDGLISVEDAQGNVQAKAVSSFIGSGSLRIDYSRRSLTLDPGDVLLVCSDGVSDTLTPAQILDATAPQLSAQQSVTMLENMIEAAALPGQDNYTALVVKYKSETDGGTDEAIG